MGSVSLINGHIDDDISISERISRLIEENYLDKNYNCHVYSFQERIENGIHLPPKNIIEEIEQIFREEKIKKYFTEIVDVVDDIDGKKGCLCISWFDGLNLHGYNEPVYYYD